MLFMTDRKSLTPDEMKQLSAWHTAHCAPGKRCDECDDVFGDPFPCERLVSSRLAADAFLLCRLRGLRGALREQPRARIPQL
jgi:hypothetical protein